MNVTYGYLKSTALRHSVVLLFLCLVSTSTQARVTCPPNPGPHVELQYVWSGVYGRM